RTGKSEDRGGNGRGPTRAEAASSVAGVSAKAATAVLTAPILTGSRPAVKAAQEVCAPVRSIRKGAADSMRTYVDQLGGTFPQAVTQAVDEISRSGATPLVVA